MDRCRDGVPLAFDFTGSGRPVESLDDTEHTGGDRCLPLSNIPFDTEIHKLTHCLTSYEAAGLCSNCWLVEPLASFE